MKCPGWALAMIFIISFLFAHAAISQSQAVSVSIAGLKCEYKINPLGLDVLRPRLSWQILAGERGWKQSAYQIRVAQDPAALNQGQGLVWDSGKVVSGESIHQTYAGPPLVSGRRYYWQVRVWDAQGQPCPWSEIDWWEMGLLLPQDWRALWIEPGLPEDVKKSNPCPMLRKEFQLRNRVRSARAYVTSLGLYQMELNGKRVGDEVLTPGWTSYDDHLQYQTYDITAQLQAGRNAVGVILGDGWYRGNLAFNGQRNTYGERLALLLHIAITYEDGSTEIIGTDAGWKAASGPIVASDIYNGESYDARLEKERVEQPGLRRCLLDSGQTIESAQNPPGGSDRAAGSPDPGDQAGGDPADSRR